MSVYEFMAKDPMGMDEFELALAVRDGRKLVRDFKHEEEKQKIGKDILQKEYTDLLEKHEQIYKRLQGLRGKTELRILRASQKSKEPKLLQALLDMVELRNQEDEVTVENLQAQLDEMRKETDRASRQLAEQRDKTLRTIRSLSSEWKNMSADALKQTSEVTRLAQERLELEARTHRACLELAQSLFGPPTH
jgi:hypothetical protein